jgi:hypothetical protein
MLILAFVALPAVVRAQEAATAESGVAAGARQVEEGDFEGAGGHARGGDSPPARRSRARAPARAGGHPACGRAHTALDHTTQAVQAFSEALTLDPNLRLDAERFSPKVLRALETAREQAARRTGAPVRKSSSGRKAAIIGGSIAVAGTAAALALRGGSTGAPTFSGARFGTPARDCPNGSDNAQLPFTILVEASNPTGEAVPINSVTTVVTIEVSPSFPGEIGFPSSQPSMVVPSSVPAKQSVTLQISSFLICGNGEGDPPRFNEWSGRVTLTTPAGVVMLNAADRMRVSIP